MFTAIIGFLFGLAVGLTAQESRRPHSRTSKWVIASLAIVLTLAFFAYTVGKDLAKRDNQAAGAIVAPAAITLSTLA